MICYSAHKVNKELSLYYDNCKNRYYGWMLNFALFCWRWVHVVCALYVPGVAFGDIDKLRPVTLTEMNYSKYGAKASTKSFLWQTAKK